MTSEQIELARHALGLGNRTLRSYRNRFVAGPLHHDYENWRAMVEAGDAREKRSIGWMSGQSYFWLSRQGAEKALVKGESLCAEDFPSPKSKGQR